jgi:hypothetical protein
LLLYDNVEDEAPRHILNNYAHTDEWNGGAWLTAGDMEAVIFAGNKGVGYTWYGCVDGEECPPDCDCGESRGWWSDRIEGQIIFYDPADLADVAQGRAVSSRPQPYAVMNIDPVLFHIDSTRQKHHVSAVAFDRPHGLLYIFEPFGDGDRPIVHVWRLSGGEGDVPHISPSPAQMAVLLSGAPVDPRSTRVLVKPAAMLLRPRLAIPEVDRGVAVTLVSYIYLPEYDEGFLISGRSQVTLGACEDFASLFPDAVDLSSLSGRRFHIYYGYYLPDGAIRYNAFELVVE